VKISILFATYKRTDILEASLRGYQSLLGNGPAFEIIIVDNACSTTTKALVSSFVDLPITYLKCAKLGKNSSLNIGLDHVKGDYVILTDDDAIPCKDWLQEYKKAFLKYPNYSIFGGAILPHCSQWPSWLNATNPQIQGAYVIRNPEDDIAVEPTYLWGPNMAIKTDIFKLGYTFDENIGPNGSDYVMGSETEFLGRLAMAGYKAMFLKKVVVNHQIRKEQLTLSWLKSRAVRQGKGLARHKIDHQQYDKSVKTLLGLPRYLLVQYMKYWLMLPMKKLTLSSKDYVSYLYKLYWFKGELTFLKSNQWDL
jgi:glycosyltransferase involved in cell wall biosynthesis